MKSLALILFLTLPLWAAEPIAPPMPDSSPVEEFRKLLKMTEGELRSNLITRSPENRSVLEAKLREYAALSDEDRHQRLNALELRWYLRTLIDYPVSRRAETIAKAPADLRPVLRDRLAVWDQMSTNAQMSILENQVIDFLASPEAPPKPSLEMMDSHLETFFKLPDQKQQKALESVQPFQRDGVSKTLSTMKKLSPDERSQTMAAFGKFAKMGETEKRAFLNKVNRWKGMSPAEQEAWRNMSRDLPVLPPLPPGFQPPMPPMPQ